MGEVPAGQRPADAAVLVTAPGGYYCGADDEATAVLLLVSFFPSLDAVVARALVG